MLIEAENNYNLNQQTMQFFTFFFLFQILKRIFFFFLLNLITFSLCGPIFRNCQKCRIIIIYTKLAPWRIAYGILYSNMKPKRMKIANDQSATYAALVTTTTQSWTKATTTSQPTTATRVTTPTPTTAAATTSFLTESNKWLSTLLPIYLKALQVWLKWILFRSFFSCISGHLIWRQSRENYFIFFRLTW